MRTTPLLVVAVLALVAAGPGALVGAGSATTAHDGLGGNYTVSFPGDRGHYPIGEGGQNVSASHSLVFGSALEGTSSPEGFRDLDSIRIYHGGLADFDFADCTPSDTGTFGIDRGNDDPGTTTDVDLTPFRKGYSADGTSIRIDFYDDRDLAGRAPRLNATDQLVATHRGCYDMPVNRGWYQLMVAFNGTGYGGDTVGSAETGPVRSHYLYVCECRNRSEAVSVLGPPPSEGGDRTTPTPTPPSRTVAQDETPMPTRTSTPTSTGVPRVTGTETVTVGELPNSTASPRSSPSPTPTATVTPSATPVDGWRGAVAALPPTTAAGGVLIAVGLVLYAVGRLVWE